MSDKLLDAKHFASAPVGSAPEAAPAADGTAGDGVTAENAVDWSLLAGSTPRLRHRIRQVLLLARLKPFDTQNELGRSMERYRRAALTAVASGAAKGMAVLTALITVPLTVGYLGMERYGLWMTISSVIAMLAFADLGLGNGLMNVLSEAN